MSKQQPTCPQGCPRGEPGPPAPLQHRVGRFCHAHLSRITLRRTDIGLKYTATGQGGLGGTKGLVYGGFEVETSWVLLRRLLALHGNRPAPVPRPPSLSALESSLTFLFPKTSGHPGLA